ncbi:RidA family protein [Haematomicrobium sanguinis]|uniref:RidA family protein n=1 Tax=Haematomicrobium sanguinis TaxID=479106 RepID=UPI000AE85182|nr:RidA family protein [Haematomicrobium sanguinis]
MSAGNDAISAVETALANLGLSVPEAPKPLAAYVPAVISGPYVYTAGQLPFINGELTDTGKVGAEVTPERAKELAEVSILNALGAIKGQIADLDRITRIVKVVGFVASDPEFYGQPGVINGASELLGSVFGDAGIHARSAVGVTVLPMNSPVEIEVIAEFV